MYGNYLMAETFNWKLKETNQEKKKLPVAEIVHFKDACIWSQEKIIAGMELRSYKR